MSRLAKLGQEVGLRMLELNSWRDKTLKRETKLLNILYFIVNSFWKTVFGKAADSLEISKDNEDECNHAFVWF